MQLFHRKAKKVFNAQQKQLRLRRLQTIMVNTEPCLPITIIGFGHEPGHPLKVPIQFDGANHETRTRSTPETVTTVPGSST